MRTRSIYFSHYQFLTPTTCFLDSPEQAPGAILGSSGVTVSASGTHAVGATSPPVSEPSSAVKPTSSPTSKSSSNTGAIVGGVVGGLLIISLAAVAIVFFLRRRRQEAPAVTPPVVGTSQPPMDEIQQPLRMDDGYAGYASSSTPGTIGTPSIPGTIGTSSMPPLAPMRIYVRVSCPIIRRSSMCADRMFVLAQSFFFFFFFDTQDPNDPTTFPGYQEVPQSPATPPQGAVPSLSGTGNSLATMQTSRAQGYNGLPTV